MGIEEIKMELERRLSPSRFEHSCQVAAVAVAFAKKTGFDEKKAEIAGLMHDIAREMTNEEFHEYAEKYQIKLTRYNNNFPPSIHGKIGAAIAEKEFGIIDEEILKAISNHVSGRPCMKTLEKITFLADHIVRTIAISPETADELMKLSLDDALYQMLGIVINYDARNKKPVDERTLQTFDWMIEVIDNNEKTGEHDIDESDLAAMYDRMDNLLELYGKCALLDFSAENIRDIGEYQGSNNRFIKKHKILRSGNLDNFTEEDFKKLSDFGINYIIDLREPYEKKKKYDVGNYVHYIEIPFESVGNLKSYLEMISEWIEECDSPEELGWLVARYFDAFEIDEMYLKIMFSPDTEKRFRKILEIMLRDDCNGVLFFCNSGKDRTGIVTGMIMKVLGVSEKDVLDDYMISSIPYYAQTMNWLNKIKRQDYNLDVQKRLISVLGVEEDRPKRLNKEIQKKYKDYKEYFNVENYLNKEELKRFEDKFLCHE